MSRPSSAAVLLALATVAYLPGSVRAQEVRSIEIIEHGIYTAEITRTERASDGLLRNVLASICHVATTTTVPAKLGLHFGFRYHLSGAPEGQIVDIRKVSLYPTGLMPPGATRPVTISEDVFKRRIGDGSYAGYNF